MQYAASRGQLGFIGLVVFVLINESPFCRASAQGIGVEVLAAKAWTALDHGDPKAAAQLFELAYDHRPQSSLIYGLAYAHDQLGDIPAAYEFYLSYLAFIDAEPAKHRIALARLDELAPLYRLLTKTPCPDLAEYQKPTLPLQWPTYLYPEIQKILSLTTIELKPFPSFEERPRRQFQPLVITALALGASGAGAIGAGFGLSRLARSEQLAFSRSFDEDFKRRARARGQALAVSSIALYATGSVLVLASVTWLRVLLRPLRRTARRDISLVPWLSPQALGGEFSWTF
ncbi:MAG TPA: hypothetical protein VH877_08525 [Polyangia bacterium]|nr:hypothetical protein [Polyangia bacterium]